MKRFIIIAVVLVFVFVNSAFAQLLSIQGVARNSEGQSLADGSYTFKFRLYDAETGGTEKWNESQTLVVKNGVFSANLGAVTSMSSLNFNVEYWLSIEIGGNGEMSPRSKLTLTPYAAMAQLNGTTNIFPSSGPVGIGTTSPETGVTLDINNNLTNDDAIFDLGHNATREWSFIVGGYNAYTGYGEYPLILKRDLGTLDGDFVVQGDNDFVVKKNG